MQKKLLEVLACPKCRGALDCGATEVSADGEIMAGGLRCADCGAEYAISAGIPRFVPHDNYAASFGYQWNLFRREQIDSVNGTNLSAKRFYAETGWTREWLAGKWVLDAGCGAGRFLDVASQNDCEVVGLDISNAVDAARATLKGRRNVHLVQASIYAPPFRPASFDACYCIGVIQHTPDPHATLRALPPLLKQGGALAVTIYERKPWTKLYAKYLVRPATRRLKKETLLRLIKGVMPVAFPLTEVGFRLPLAGRLLQFALPIANYTNEPTLNREQRYRWALMDTFDMLAPEYDQPQTETETRAALTEAGMTELERLPNGGVNIVGRKA